MNRSFLMAICYYLALLVFFLFWAYKTVSAYLDPGVSKGALLFYFVISQGMLYLMLRPFNIVSRRNDDMEYFKSFDYYRSLF
jgi:hypothetical protein